LQTVNKNKTSEFKQHDNVFKTCGDYMLKDARISRALPLESSLKIRLPTHMHSGNTPVAYMCCVNCNDP